MSSPTERPRIEEFRKDLATRLSKLSTDPALLEDMNRQSLEALVTGYVHWAIRAVAARARKVIVKQPDDPHWKKIAPKAAALLKCVEAGGDVTAYICFSPHLRDFVIPGGAYPGWRDMDLVLAIMGYHVFQCEPRDVARTGNHILAFVDRSTFTVIGAFQGNAILSDPAERARVWNLVQAHGTAPVDPQHLVRVSMARMQKIAEMDPKLDDPAFVRQLYVETGTTMPPAPKFRWHMTFSDFGFLEMTAPRFFMIWPGPN